MRQENALDPSFVNSATNTSQQLETVLNYRPGVHHGIGLVRAMKPALSPSGWPFAQSHVLLVQKQQEHEKELERRQHSTNIRDVEFQSEDEGSDYSPQEESEDGESTDEDDLNDDAAESMIVDDDEVEDLVRDSETGWPPSLTLAEKQRLKDEQFNSNLALLEVAEKEAATTYNPDEIVALITELYQLLVEMGQWQLGSVQEPPHMSPAVNTKLGEELGFNQDVLDLMQKLPYLKGEANTDESQFIPDSQLLNYTDERDLEKSKKHVGYDNYQAPIEAYMLPLATPSTREGWSIVLDTILGVIRAYRPACGSPLSSIENLRYGELEQGVPPLEYHRAPLVPAAKYLRTLIEGYRSLDRVPLVHPYHFNLDFVKESHKGYFDWYWKLMEYEQTSVMGLYTECGWPDDWDRPTFMGKWKVLKEEHRKRRSEIIKSSKRK